ncbi:MAG: hypothetical protein ACLS4Z_00875 [Christensenellaceae bacterium]
MAFSEENGDHACGKSDDKGGIDMRPRNRAGGEIIDDQHEDRANHIHENSVPAADENKDEQRRQRWDGVDVHVFAEKGREATTLKSSTVKMSAIFLPFASIRLSSKK